MVNNPAYDYNKQQQWLEQYAPSNLTFEEAKRIEKDHGLQYLYGLKKNYDEQKRAENDAARIRTEHDGSGFASDYEDGGPTSETKHW